MTVINQGQTLNIIPLKTMCLFLIDLQFSFTGDDYHTNEPSPGNPTTFLPVVVSKSAQIASRVEIVVVPLTVVEARATSLPLPPNIPNDDQRSPPFARKRNNIIIIIPYDINYAV
jgi:hypothetical protein